MNKEKKEKLEKTIEEAADALMKLWSDAAAEHRNAEVPGMDRIDAMLPYLQSTMKKWDDMSGPQQVLHLSLMAAFLYSVAGDRKGKTAQEQAIRALPALPFLVMAMKGQDARTQREQIAHALPALPFMLPVAAPVTPLVTVVLKLWEGDREFKKLAADFYKDLDGELHLNDKMLEKLSDAIRSIPRKDLHLAIEESQAGAETVQQLLTLGRLFSFVPESVVQDWSKIVSDALPKRVVEGMTETRDTGTDEITAAVATKKNIWDKFKAAVNSDEDNEEQPGPVTKVVAPTVDALTDATYATLQKCTPEALGVFLADIHENVSKADLESVAKSGKLFAEDLYETVAKKNGAPKKHDKHVDDFSAALRKILQTVEDAMDDADIMHVEDVENVRRQSRPAGPGSNSANDNDGPQAPQI